MTNGGAWNRGEKDDTLGTACRLGDQGEWMFGCLEFEDI